MRKPPRRRTPRPVNPRRYTELEQQYLERDCLLRADWKLWEAQR